jgi:hypothetical protein
MNLSQVQIAMVILVETSTFKRPISSKCLILAVEFFTCFRKKKLKLFNRKPILSLFKTSFSLWKDGFEYSEYLISSLVDPDSELPAVESLIYSQNILANEVCPYSFLGRIKIVYNLKGLYYIVQTNCKIRLKT